MELSIQKWGNSAAIRLPAALLDRLQVALGDKLAVDIRPDGIMLKPKRQTYVLEDLIAQCNQNAPMPEDLSVWNGLHPVGREAW
jgi:antitoxin ChpS